MAAAKQLLQSADFRQKFQDIMECPICIEAFTDPRILPCVHTFCVKCLEATALKSNRVPGNCMPCPICRKEFQIPVDGVKMMPKNFLMEKLLEMSNVQNSFSKDNLEEEGPSDELFCRKCCMKACECRCTHHQKRKMSKDNELISVNGSSAMSEMVSDQDLCNLHESERLKIYCSRCEKVVCAFCFIQDHQNHTWLDVNKAGEEFRQQIKTKIENLRKRSKDIEGQKIEAIIEKSNLYKTVSDQESMIDAKKETLLQLIEKVVGSLKLELELKRQEKLKEIVQAEEEFDFHIQIQETYASYCHEIVSKGSHLDICRVQSELRLRAEELQRLCQLVPQRKRKPSEIDLRLNRFDDLQKYIEESFVEGLEGKAIAEENGKCFRAVLQIRENRVTGMAIIDQEFFVATEENSTVQVYDSDSFHLIRSWSVTGLTCPADMAASEGAKILYIFDVVGKGTIFRVSPDGTLLSSWIAGSPKIRISTWLEAATSVNSEENVIMTYVGTQKSKEFQPSKKTKLLQQVVFTSNCNFVIKIESDLYLLATNTEVLLARVSGKVSFEASPVKIDCPKQMAIDQTTGFIFVNDIGKRRVLMLNARLEYVTEITSPTDGLCNSHCMVLDGRSRRLLIADFDNVNKCGRILTAKVD